MFKYWSTEASLGGCLCRNGFEYCLNDVKLNELEFNRIDLPKTDVCLMKLKWCLTLMM